MAVARREDTGVALGIFDGTQFECRRHFVGELILIAGKNSRRRPGGGAAAGPFALGRGATILPAIRPGRSNIPVYRMIDPGPTGGMVEAVLSRTPDRHLGNYEAEAGPGCRRRSTSGRGRAGIGQILVWNRQ